MTSADVTLMRDWLKQNKHLPQDLDDYFLECFIKCSKQSVSRAKQTLENFCMLRHKLEFTFHINWDPFSDEMIDMVNRMSVVKLPKRTPEGYNIIIINISPKGEPDPLFCLKMMVLCYYLLLLLLWEHDLGTCESVIINDWKNISLQDFKGVTPALLSEFAKVMTGSLPHRIKAIYDLNVPTVAEWVFNFLKPLWSEKMSLRRFGFSGYEEILHHLSKDLLPSELGGDLPGIFEIYENTTKAKFMKYRERFITERQKVLAEKPFVPNHLNTDCDTFRKLDID